MVLTGFGVQHGPRYEGPRTITQAGSKGSTRKASEALYFAML